MSHVGHTVINKDNMMQKIFIIGGAQLFKEGLIHPELDGIYLTKINKTYDCDTFLEKIPKKFTAKKLGSDSEKGSDFDYMLLTSSSTSAG